MQKFFDLKKKHSTSSICSIVLLKIFLCYTEVRNLHNLYIGYEKD